MAKLPEFDASRLDALKEFQSGGRPLVDVLIEDYLQTSTQLLNELLDAWKAKNLQKVRFNAHSLKSSSLTLGLDGFGHLCRDIENEATTEAMLAPMIADLPAVFERGCAWLKSRSKVGS